MPVVLLPYRAARVPRELRRRAVIVSWDRDARPRRIRGLVGGPTAAGPVSAEAALPISGAPTRRRAPRASWRIALSPAAFVEPALLRAVRLEALPHLGVEAEVDLWFSPLVRDRTTEGMSFAPDAIRLLQQRLLDWLERRGPPRARRTGGGADPRARGTRAAA